MISLYISRRVGAISNYYGWIPIYPDVTTLYSIYINTALHFRGFLNWRQDVAYSKSQLLALSSNIDNYIQVQVYTDPVHGVGHRSEGWTHREWIGIPES